jgi:serine acetyltransferase
MKLLVAVLAAVMPFGALRRGLLNLLSGYRIHPSVRIGLGTIVYVDSFQVGEGTVIGMGNLFKGPIAVTIGARSRIGRVNKFLCGRGTTDPRHGAMNYARRLEIGDRCLVLNGHYFDVYGLVKLGDGTWIAGVDSQFWTHGISAMDRDIVLGSNNYVGSGVKFAPGTSIGDDNIVALGSVVLSKLTGSNTLISGFPAKEIKSILEKKQSGEYRFSFEDW